MTGEQNRLALHALHDLITPARRLDFDAYTAQLDATDPDRLALCLVQAHVAIGQLAADVLGRPLDASDEAWLAGVVAGRHGRMLPADLGPALRLLVREIVAPGTALDGETSTATLLYPVVLAAVMKEREQHVPGPARQR